MKRIIFILGALLALMLTVGCGKKAEAPRPNLTGPKVSETTVLGESECRDIAASLYPAGTDAEFERMEELFGATSLIYNVIREADDKIVGLVAVSANDGSAHIWNMSEVDPADEDLTADTVRLKGGWLPAKAFVAGLMAPDSLPGTYYELILDVEDLTGLSDRLFFAHLTEFEQLLPQCEGRAFWREGEGSLELALTVVTGSLEGLPAGPGLNFLVHWGENGPEVALSVPTPAPMFTDPDEALYSGELRELEDEEIIELAEFLRDKIIALKADMTK